MEHPTSIPTLPGETEDERRLVEEVRRVCGPHLSAFLLAGYGEESPVRHRSFGVTGEDPGGPCDLRVIEAWAGFGSELPRGREPLVWAALLCELFRNGGELQVVLSHGELLGRMGRENTAGGRALVQRALDRYAGIEYVEIRVPALVPGRDPDPYSLVRMHPVVELMTAAVDGLPVWKPGADVVAGAGFSVEFGEPFVVSLVSGGLFRAVWEGIVSRGE